MKQIFTFLFLFIFLTGFSQSLSIVDDAGNSIDGQVIERQGLPDASIELYLNVKNVSNSPVNVRAIKQYIEILDNTSNTFCFAGSCYGSSVMISGRSYSLAAGEILPGHDVTNGFHASYNPNDMAGFSYIKYSFVNAEDTASDKTSVIVRFNTFPESTFEMDKENTAIYPNPVDNFVHINTGESIKQVVITDLLGKVVYKNESVEQSLDVNMADYNKGIYIMTFFDENQNFFSRKVMKK